MGNVLVAATIENIHDINEVRKKTMAESAVRRVEVTDARVDSGASGLLIPQRMIDFLELNPVRTRTSRTVAGVVTITMYEAVRLTVQGRSCVTDVAGISDDLPIIIGQLPLQAMDWVVDMNGHRVMGNPEHGGEDMFEIL